MSRWLKRLSIGTAVLALLYGAACAYMWATQREHVFEPTVTLQTAPDRLGMPYQELHIPAGSGAEQGELYAWWIPAEQANAPVFLYFHGNYRNLSNNLEHAQRLHALGYHVLVADYRGYGKSSGGPPSEAKIYQDAEAVWQFLVNTRGVPPQQVFIYGHSLGGAVALDLAVRHPEAAAVITESTFTSLVDIGKREYGYLPVDWLLNQRFDSQAKIPQLRIPVLLIHGTWDQRVPVQMARQLYAAAPSPKLLVLIEGGEHSNSGTVGWAEYREALTAFVRRVLGNRR